MCVSDNGAELTGMAILRWSQSMQVEWHYIAPGKPQQNTFIESFNGRLRDELLAVNAADPMDDQNDLGCVRIDISDYLMNDGANDAFFQPRIGRGSVQTVLRAAASVASDPESATGAGLAASWGGDFFELLVGPTTDVQ
jgi:transposase InsO family protein